MLLIDSNVEKIQLEVGKLENKAFDEDGAVVIFLLAVVFEVSGIHCYLLELHVKDCRNDGLGD